MEQRTIVAGEPVQETNDACGLASGATRTSPDRSLQERVLWLLGLGVVYWWVLLHRLSIDWSINPQYGYGWSVPFLAVWLGWRRWLDRPDPEPKVSPIAWALPAVLLLLSLMPSRLVEEANPEWRLVLWVHALTLTALSCELLRYCGGRPWFRHFAFPVCFLLISVPWPSGIEQALIQGLTQVVARATVEILALFGIVAFQHGNLIEVGTGIVGVDEACSGVRSLQTSVMISLFLGELYRFTAGRRLLMLALGMALALVANLCRTFFLVWNAARHGIQSVDRWHDTAGLAIVGVVFAGLWLLALRLRNGTELSGPRQPATQTTPRLPRARLLVLLTAWFAFVSLGTEAWYRAHERNLVSAPSWAVEWPATSWAFRDVPLTEKARAILRCDAGRGAAWKDDEQNHWLGFFLEWEPGRNSAQLARGHTPDVCMPATGRKLVRDHEKKSVPVHGLDLPFRRYEFSAAGGRPLFVFYCNWESARSVESVVLREDWTAASRIESVRLGKRHLGQQVLQLAVEGPASLDRAEAALSRELERIVRRTQGKAK